MGENSLSIVYELRMNLNAALDIITKERKDRNTIIHLFIEGFVTENEQPLNGVVVHGVENISQRSIVEVALLLGAGLIVLHSEHGGIYAGPVDEFDTEFLLNQLSYADIVKSPLTCIDVKAVQRASDYNVPIILTDTSDESSLIRILCNERVGTLISKKEFGEK